MNVKFKASARTTALHRTGAGRQRNPTAPVGGEVFSLDIPFHRTNETRETHETQNIRLVFWGLQRKHEEYREVGVGLALPFTLFSGQRGETETTVKIASGWRIHAVLWHVCDLRF